MIVEGGGGYQVLSKRGKNLGGPYKTLEEAKMRLRQVEYLKHLNPRRTKWRRVPMEWRRDPKCS
jgi:hypothetical protein